MTGDSDPPDAVPARQFTRSGLAGSRWRGADPQGDAVRHAARHQRSQSPSSMPVEIQTGQSWSVWVPSRRQWLLAVVTSRRDGQAMLKFDARYGIGRGHDEQQAEEALMLSAPNLFRFVEAPG